MAVANGVGAPAIVASIATCNAFHVRRKRAVGSRQKNEVEVIPYLGMTNHIDGVLVASGS